MSRNSSPIKRKRRENKALELEKLLSIIDKGHEVRRKVLQSSNRALKKLLVDDDTNHAAMYLANICVELDSKFGVGSTLCLDWMLEHYMAIEFERRVYPWFIEIYEALKGNNYIERNKFDYFSDCEAFYIPHESKKIVVMGSWWKYGGTKSLSIDNLDNGLFSKFYVRKIWKRTRRNCINTIDQATLSLYKELDFSMKFNEEHQFYGDCRDNGHVMTYEKRMDNDSKCDKVIWDLNVHTQWFFEVNSLWTQLVSDSDSGPTVP